MSPVGPAPTIRTSVSTRASRRLARPLVEDEQPLPRAADPHGAAERHGRVAFRSRPRGETVRRERRIRAEGAHVEVVDARLEGCVRRGGGEDGLSVEDASGATELDELVREERGERVGGRADVGTQVARLQLAQLPYEG